MYTKDQLEILTYEGLAKVERELTGIIEKAVLADDWSTVAVAKKVRNLAYQYAELRRAESVIQAASRAIADMGIPDPFPPGLNEDLITVLDKHRVFISTTGGWAIHLGDYWLDVETHDESKQGLMRSVAFPGLDGDIAALNEKYNLYARD